MSSSFESPETPSNEPGPTGNSDERMWAMFAHLAGPLTTYVLGGMGWIGPLIIWLIKKDSSRFVDDQGKESLNFQINLLGQALIGVVVTFVLSFVTCGFGLLVIIPLWIVWAVYATVMPIIAGISANGGTRYRYPATIRVIT
jgi:uncharacterized protein